MKKLLSLLAVAGGISGIASCGTDLKSAAGNNTGADQNKKTQEELEREKNADRNQVQGQQVSSDEFLNELTDCEKDFINNVKKDGIYLLPTGFDGTVKSDNEDDCVRNLSLTGKNQYSSNVVQLGEGDSMYMIYDNDDNDGFSPTNFTDTVFFNDTSIMHTTEIEAHNKEIGNQLLTDSRGWNKDLIPFLKDGDLNHWEFSQSNHTGVNGFEGFSSYINEQFKKGNVSDQALTLYSNYYGLTITKEGEGLKIIKSGQGASTAFVPIFTPKGIFTFEKVSDRVIKITSHSSLVDSITAAHFILHSDTETETFGVLSIGGEEEWRKYNRGNYDVVGSKNLPAPTLPSLVHEGPLTPEVEQTSPVVKNEKVVDFKHAEPLVIKPEWLKTHLIPHNSFEGRIVPASFKFPPEIWYIDKEAFKDAIFEDGFVFPEHLEAFASKAFEGAKFGNHTQFKSILKPNLMQGVHYIFKNAVFGLENTFGDSFTIREFDWLEGASLPIGTSIACDYNDNWELSMLEKAVKDANAHIPTGSHITYDPTTKRATVELNQ